MQWLKAKSRGAATQMRPVQPTIPHFPALKRPFADLLRGGPTAKPVAAKLGYSDSPFGRIHDNDEDAWDDEEEWEPENANTRVKATTVPGSTSTRAAVPPPPPSQRPAAVLARQSVGLAAQSGSVELDDDEWDTNNDSEPDVPPVQLVRTAANRASEPAPISRDDLADEFFSRPPEAEPEPADFSDIDSLAAAAMKIDPRRQEMARKVVIAVMSSMAFLLVVSAGIAALGRGEEKPSVQAAPSAVRGNLSAAAELAASRVPGTITYKRAEAEAARQNAEAVQTNEEPEDHKIKRLSKYASPAEVAAYRRAKARQRRIQAAKKRPRPTGSSGGMLRRF